jgi:hypothetical protein
MGPGAIERLAHLRRGRKRESLLTLPARLEQPEACPRPSACACSVSHLYVRFRVGGLAFLARGGWGWAWFLFAAMADAESWGAGDAGLSRVVVDGNPGQAVVRGASRFGCRARESKGRENSW